MNKCRFVFHSFSFDGFSKSDINFWKSLLSKTSLVFLTAFFIALFAIFDVHSEQSNEKLDEHETNKRDGKIEKLDESRLPNPVKGYKWKILSEMNGAFQIPENWHFYQQEIDSQLIYYFSKEEIQDERSYSIGLSVSMIKNAKTKLGKDAVKYARDLIAEMMKKSDTIGTAVGQKSTVFQFTCRSRTIMEDGTSKVIHKLAMGNSRTDTFYLFTYEFPELDKKEADSIAWVTFNLFVLDDEI